MMSHVNHLCISATGHIQKPLGEGIMVVLWLLRDAHLGRNPSAVFSQRIGQASENQLHRPRWPPGSCTADRRTHTMARLLNGSVEEGSNTKAQNMATNHTGSLPHGGVHCTLTTTPF